MYNYFKFKDELDRTIGYLEQQSKLKHWAAKHESTSIMTQTISSNPMTSTSRRSRSSSKWYVVSESDQR